MSSKKHEFSQAQIQSTAVDLVQGVIRLEDVPYEVRKGVARLFAERLNMELGQTPQLPELRKGELRVLIQGISFDRMYEQNLETLKRFDLLDRRPPTLRRVLASFLPRELAIAGGYRTPSLVLLPPEKNFEDLESALTATMNGERASGPMVTDLYRQVPSVEPVWNDYRAVIVEGASRIDPSENDTLSAPLGHRRILVQRERHPEESGMTREIYMLMAMQCLATGTYIDQKTFTVLDEDPAVSEYYIPTAGFNDERPAFYWVPSDVSFSGRGRFRSVVGGKKPIDPGLGVSFVQKVREALKRRG